MLRDERPWTWMYKGKPLTLSQPGWYCTMNPDHDPILDESDSRATQATMFAHRVVVEGGVHPEEIRRICIQLGLSQRQAGKVIGGGPLAFHKYESGQIATTYAMGTLLRLLDRHPELVGELREFGRSPA